jgi:uncharacterized membrane protein
MSQSHIEEQIELIAQHEQEFLDRRTPAERVSDGIAGFIGSLPFITLHLFIFAAWIVLNLLPHTRHFDPKPFSLLQTCVAMEAIFAASFILMRQARMGRRSDERDHLMLQILLLTEKELTALLGMDRQIASEMGLTRVANSPEVRDLSQQTSIAAVAQTIKDNLQQSS